MMEKNREDRSFDKVCIRPLDTCKAALKSKGPPWWRSYRYLVAVLQFWGLAILFFHRNHFNIALVCMVNHTAVDIQYHDLIHTSVASQFSQMNGSQNDINVSYYGTINATSDVDAPSSCRDVAEERKEDGPYVWSRDVQGVLLGAMFWSYMALQIPGAVLADRYLTVKVTIIVSLAAMSVVHLLMPLLADLSPWVVMAARLLVGLCVGVFIVAFYKVWAKWGPPEERGRLIAITNGGNQLGNTCVFPLSGLLCRSPLGWPAIFYTFSVFGLVWCLLCLVLFYESPDVHPRISAEEREYIVSAIANSTTKQRKGPLPWKKILTSVPLWAIALALFSYNWAVFQMTSTLPIFMREVLKFDIKSNGLFSSLPFLASWLVLYVSGFVSDLLIERRILSVIHTRKAVQASGHMTAALCLVLVSFLDCNHQGAAVALLTLSVGLTAVCLTTLPVNIYDVAPKYFSICYSVCNTLAVIPGFLAPMVVAELTKEKTREQWQVTFFITAAIMVAGTLVFLVFGRGSPLPWATGENVAVEVQNSTQDKPPPEAEKLFFGDSELADEK